MPTEVASVADIVALQTQINDLTDQVATISGKILQLEQNQMPSEVKAAWKTVLEWMVAQNST